MIAVINGANHTVQESLPALIARVWIQHERIVKVSKEEEKAEIVLKDPVEGDVEETDRLKNNPYARARKMRGLLIAKVKLVRTRKG